MQPLIVSVETIRPYLSLSRNGGIALDGLLGWVVASRDPERFGETIQPPELPLLEVWRSPDGLPLWAATPLYPTDPQMITRYYHRRSPDGYLGLLDVVGKRYNSSGPYKDVRVPLPAYMPGTLVALAIGEAGPIREMLSSVTSIGRRRNVAGAVREWGVTELDLPQDQFLESILQQRPVPLRYLRGLHKPAEAGIYEHVGWTPPYYYVPWHEACRL